MKRNIFALLIAFITVISVSSCKKEADVEGVSQKLPALQLSSIGLTQTGPFATSSTIQLLFAATTTNSTPDNFKLEISDNGTKALVSTVNFASWNGKDATNNHTISYTLASTTYPNTQVYNGSILLKLSSLGLTAGKTYDVKAYAYNKDSKVSTYTQSALIKVQ